MARKNENRETMGDLDEDDELDPDEDLDEDDPDEDEDDDEDEGDEDEDGPKPKKKTVPVDLRAVLRKNRIKARRAVAEAARLREENERLRKAGGKKRPASRRDEDDDDEVEEKVKAARGEGMKLAIRAEAKTALLAAGVNPGEGNATLKKALRLLDFDDITLDEDGEPEGLEEQIVELREEMPELFRKARKKRDINGTDSRSSSGKPRKKSASELQAEQLKKGSR